MHVVGHSFGGQVALDLALLAPARVRALTLICSRDTPFPAFAATAAALRRGDPVDPDAALGRCSRRRTPRHSPVVRYARRCAAGRPPVVGSALEAWTVDRVAARCRGRLSPFIDPAALARLIHGN